MEPTDCNVTNGIQIKMHTLSSTSWLQKWSCLSIMFALLSFFRLISGSLFRSVNELEEWMVDAAYHLLTCDLDKIPPSTLYHYFILGRMDHFRLYADCMAFTAPSNSSQKDTKVARHKHYKNTFPQCKSVLVKSCKKYNIRAFKTIRMTIPVLRRVLAKYPEIKAIYSTRDPRAIVNSRYEIARKFPIEAKTWNFTFKSRELCLRMKEDLEHIKGLKMEFPHNFMQTSFEEVVDDPVGVTDSIYRFLSLKRPENVARVMKQYLKVKLRSPEGNVTGKWRTCLSSDAIESVSRECATVCQQLGITPN